MNQTTRQSVYLLSWRSRWLRSVLALVLVVLAARLIWGWYADCLLRAQLDEIRRRGEPVVVDDVTFERVPDWENAWPVLVKAAQASQSGVWSPRASNDEYRNYPPYPPFWMKRAQDSEKANAQAFTLARRARALSRVQIRDRLTSPMVNSLPTYNGMRNLANTVGDGALYAHLQGNDAEAIERLLDVLHQGRSLHQDPFIISQLVGTGIDALALETAQIIGPGLRLEDHATRELLRRLISQSLEEEPSWRGFQASLPMERLASLDSSNSRARGSWFIRPLAAMEMVRSNRNFALAVEASRLRNQPRAATVLARMQLERTPANPFEAFFGRPPPPSIPRYSRWFLNWWDPSRYFETQFRNIAERRATAVILAAQLYRADHGNWPQRLEELVPAYLPAVPADPFMVNEPMKYVVIKGGLPGGGDRPLIYYEAGKGESEGPSGEPMCGFYQSNQMGHHAPLRQYRDLARWTLAPSTKTVHDDP